MSDRFEIVATPEKGHPGHHTYQVGSWTTHVVVPDKWEEARVIQKALRKYYIQQNQTKKGKPNAI